MSARQWTSVLTMLLAAGVLPAAQPIAAQPRIEVGAGSSLELGAGRIQAGCASLRLAGRLDLGRGSLAGLDDIAVDGALAGSTGVLAWSGDWSGGGSFDAGASIAEWGDGCAGGSASLLGNWTFSSLSLDSESGRELRWQSASTQTVRTAFAASGVAGQRLRIRSTQPGSEAFLDLLAGASQQVFAIDVDDNHAVGTAIAPDAPAAQYASIRGDNAEGWFESLPDPVPPLPIPAGGPLSWLLLILGLLVVAGVSFVRSGSASRIRATGSHG